MLIFSKGMHAGVLRDVEQQRIRRERQLDFDMQRALEQEYKKIQTVHETTDSDSPTPPN
jgi:protein PET117